MTRKPPVHIVEALKNYDPLLRLRFSVERKSWVLERKCERIFLKKPVKYVSDGLGGEIAVRLPADSDVYIQYHDGYTDIRMAIPNPLPAVDVLMENIFRSDTSKKGKYYIKSLEEQWEREEHDREIKQNAHLRELSSHTWDEIHMAGSRDLASMKKFKTRN